MCARIIVRNATVIIVELKLASEEFGDENSRECLVHRDFDHGQGCYGVLLEWVSPFA